MESHTAYERALDLVRPFINDATKSLDGDLEHLYNQIRTAKEAKTDTKEVEQDEQSKDVEMGTG